MTENSNDNPVHRACIERHGNGGHTITCSCGQWQASGNKFTSTTHLFELHGEHAGYTVEIR